MGKAGALFSYYCDPTVNDILINGTQTLFLDRRGAMVGIENPFEHSVDLLHFIERLVLPIGKRIDAAQPYLEGRLVDGGRFHVILPPVAVDGPYISIRKPGQPGAISLSDFGPSPIIDWLRSAISRRINLLVCGSTGSGKTTLVSRCIDSLMPSERIVLIEETAEIQSTHSHIVRLESRVATPEGSGGVTSRDLLRNALRMRPDRIILGECRGAEAFDFIQALNTGHRGSLGTIHANSCLDALKRLEGLMLTTGYEISPKVAREWIASSVGAVIYLQRDGTERRIVEVISITGLEGDLYRHLPIYRLAQ